MSEDEWIDECASLLTVEPFNWPELKAREYAAGLLSFFGVEFDPEKALDEDRQYWDCEESA